MGRKNRNKQDKSYGRIIRYWMIGLATPGVIAGLALSVWGLMQFDKLSGPRSWLGLIAAPVVIGGMGSIFGFCLAFAFAPTEFLKGPDGAKWMEKTGVKNILLGRLLAVVMGLLFVGFIGLMSWLLIEAMMKPEPESAAFIFGELSARARG